MPSAVLQSLTIAAAVAQRLQITSALGYPEEVCGLLLGRWTTDRSMIVSQAVSVPNSAAAEDRRHRYSIAPRLMLEWERIAQRESLAIVGFYHSHPNAMPVPSSTDAALAWPGYAYVIVSTRAGTSDGAIAWVSGMAAWTFVEASASFVEVPVTVEVAADEIEYFI